MRNLDIQPDDPNADELTEIQETFMEDLGQELLNYCFLKCTNYPFHSFDLIV